MTNPRTAERIGLIIDPSDREFWAFEVSQGLARTDILQPGEEPVSIALEATAAATSVGLSIMAGEKAPVIEGRNVMFWCEIAPAFWADPVFDGAGADLPIKVTILTTFNRVKQYTITIGTEQK